MSVAYWTNSRPDIICERVEKGCQNNVEPHRRKRHGGERTSKARWTIYGVTFSGSGPCQILLLAVLMRRISPKKAATLAAASSSVWAKIVVLSLPRATYTQTLLGTVRLSTQHSEVQAPSDAKRYAVYFRNIASEPDLAQEPVKLLEDNNAAWRSPRVKANAPLCVEAQNLGFISVCKIDTKLQRADQSTKILPVPERSIRH